MLTPQEEEAAKSEANRWLEWLKYFEAVYELSFAKHGISRNTALHVIAAANFGTPALVDDTDEGEEPWQKA